MCVRVVLLLSLCPSLLSSASVWNVITAGAGAAYLILYCFNCITKSQNQNVHYVLMRGFERKLSMHYTKSFKKVESSLKSTLSSFYQCGLFLISVLLKVSLCHFDLHFTSPHIQNGNAFLVLDHTLSRASRKIVKRVGAAGHELIFTIEGRCYKP